MKSFALIVVSLVVIVGVHAQPMQWGMLRFNPPDNWSEQTTRDRITFSNYATGQELPVSITFHPLYNYTAKPDTAFAFAWRSMFAANESNGIPRARKLFTQDGDLFYLGGGEIQTTKGNKYSQLAVFLKDGYAQPVEIRYEDIKAWKTQQYEYLERLQEVKVAGKKEE